MINSATDNSIATFSQGAKSTDDIRRLAATNEQAAMQEATKQFEGLFVQMMLKSMRSTVGENGLFSSSAMQTFQDMQDTETAKQVAAAGGFGLTDQTLNVIMEQAGMEVEPLNTVDYLQNRGGL